MYIDGLQDPNDNGAIVRRPIGLPITAGFDAARDQTRVCSDTSSTEMQCTRPLRHSGALTGLCGATNLHSGEPFVEWINFTLPQEAINVCSKK